MEHKVETHIDMNDTVVINFNKNLLLQMIGKLIEGIDKQPAMFKKELDTPYNYLKNLENNVREATFGFEAYWDNLREVLKYIPQDLSEYILLDVVKYIDEM